MTNTISTLDTAFGLAATQKPEAALQATLAVVNGNAGQLSAVLLLSRLLAKGPHAKVAIDAAERLAEAFSRRGDLPQAVLASLIVRLGGKDSAPTLRHLGETFGRGSTRTSDVSPAPPPFPPRDIPTLKDTGPALEAKALQALKAFLATADPMPAGAPVPKLPLFGALPPKELTELLGSFAHRSVGTGHAILHEGEEGKEALVLARGVARVTRKSANGEIVTLAELGPGAIFGEMALLSDAPRAGTVTALEPCELLTISRGQLEKLAERMPSIGSELAAFCRARMVANLVRQSEMFTAIPAAERMHVVGHFTEQHFAPGDRLLTRGDEPNGLFLIASGAVDVRSVDEDGDELRVAALGPGDVVGEISMVLRRPAAADVVATYPTIALVLGRDAFHAVIKEHPRVLAQLYELASKRDDEMRSVVGQRAVDLGDEVIV